MITKQANELQLNNFINYCKKDKEFKKIDTFKNSVLIHFKKSLYSDLYEHLKKLDNRVMIYTHIDLMNNELELVVFIYKNLSYEID